MRVRWLRGFIAGLLAVSATVPAGAAQSVALLSVQSGHSVILKTPGLERVAVGDARIAGVLPVGTSQLVVNGKAPGQTTVFVWEGGGQSRTFEVTVTEQGMDDLARMLQTSIDDPNVSVVSFRDSVVLRGTVVDGAHYQQLADILSQFQPYAAAQKDTIINAVTVEHPLQEIQHDLMAIPGANDVRVDVDNKGNVIVSGHVHDTVTEAAVLEQAKGLAGTFLSATGQLIDRMSTDEHSQVDIKVYVLEVDRTAESTLGVSLQAANFQNGGSAYTLGPPSFPAVESPQPAGGALKIGAFFRTITLAPTLNLLMSQGHARVLSSPDLVTTPGNLATFLVGGRFPVPFSTGLGQVSIEYEPYGVQLNVTPTLLGNGDVESKITPDVSNLDFADAVQEGGFLIPALKESKISTDIITQPGQSIIMGGMVSHVENKTIQKIPLLSSIPILGKLFQSTAYQNDQTDVVFVMTPDIITR
jgi:Flp pilus assembly secretin CpaC